MINKCSFDDLLTAIPPYIVLQRASFELKIFVHLQEIHGLLREGYSVDNISSQLSPWASALFEFLPPFIRKQVYFCILLILFTLSPCKGINFKL